MGCFGYICKGCKTPIRGDCLTGGENAVLIHVRHGEELGRVVGHYDEYGRVIEDENKPEVEKFRGNYDGINGHLEICKSDFDLEDSYQEIKYMRIYNNSNLTYFQFVCALKNEFLMSDNKENTLIFSFLNQKEKTELLNANFNNAEYFYFMDMMINRNYQLSKKINQYFLSLPKITLPAYSGIVAWHKKCYDKATEEERLDLTPSDSDPNQSWGKVRKKYQ